MEERVFDSPVFSDDSQDCIWVWLNETTDEPDSFGSSDFTCGFIGKPASQLCN